MTSSKPQSPTLTEEQSKFVKSKFYRKGRTRLVALVIVLLLVATGVGLYQWYQMDFADKCIQGYWLISDDTFLLIDDSVIRVVKIVDSAQSKSNLVYLFEDTKSKISYNSILSTSVHKFTIARSNTSSKKEITNVSNLFESNELILEVTPALGVCTIKHPLDPKASIVGYKDPLMTLDYFKK